MKYGLLTYPSSGGIYNIGDYIQSIAARQYLPRVDHTVNREEMTGYNDAPIKMIMNGWYMHYPENWPPSKMIHPLFISVHINASVKNRLLTNSGINYLKEHEPIGCRDLYTLQVLRSRHINAYYSGCLTTTLDLQYKSEDRDNHVYIVDPNCDRLDSFIDTELLERAIKVQHEYVDIPSEEIRFQRADTLLQKYARARLVITSRLHCALPCLGLGTPVIFIQSAGEDESYHCRFGGLTDLFNTIFIEKGNKIRSNFGLRHGERINQCTVPENNDKYLEYAGSLKEKCRVFVS